MKKFSYIAYIIIRNITCKVILRRKKSLFVLVNDFKVGKVDIITVK
jgi:hypothetical protein